MLEKLAMYKHSSLIDLFVSYKENYKEVTKKSWGLYSQHFIFFLFFSTYNWAQ